MAATPRFAHVVLQTGQPQTLADWYCRLLQGHVVYADHGLTFITFDEEHHRVAFVCPPQAVARKSPTAAGMHHMAYTFECLDDLLERYTQLRADGVLPASPVQHGVTTSLYYRDPDGNYVEFQIDNFADPDAATEYMHGAEYDADPIGPAFEVDRMVQARREGASVEELTTRAWALAGPPQADPRTVLMS